jgi:hypothetical protein
MAHINGEGKTLILSLTLSFSLSLISFSVMYRQEKGSKKGRGGGDGQVWRMCLHSSRWQGLSLRPPEATPGPLTAPEAGSRATPCRGPGAMLRWRPCGRQRRRGRGHPLARVHALQG